MPGTYKRSDETKEKQSIAAKERWSKNSESYKEALKKRDMSNAGRKRTFQRFDRECIVCGESFEIKTTAAAQSKKCCSRSCYNHYFKMVITQSEDYRNQRSEISKGIDRSYMQTEEYSLSKRKEDTPEYMRYKNKVHKLSEKTYVENVEVINPNNYPRTLCGVDGGWQLDHIKTVRECFDDGISEEEAASLNNLRMLPWKENLMRNFS